MENNILNLIFKKNPYVCTNCVNIYSIRKLVEWIITVHYDFNTCLESIYL